MEYGKEATFTLEDKPEGWVYDRNGVKLVFKKIGQAQYRSIMVVKPNDPPSAIRATMALVKACLHTGYNSVQYMESVFDEYPGLPDALATALLQMLSNEHQELLSPLYADGRRPD